MMISDVCWRNCRWSCWRGYFEWSIDAMNKWSNNNAKNNANNNANNNAMTLAEQVRRARGGGHKGYLFIILIFSNRVGTLAWSPDCTRLCVGTGPRPRSAAPVHTSAPDASADTCRTSDQDPLRVQYGGTGGGGPWLLRGFLQGKPPLINHSMRRMARYGTQSLKWNLVVVSKAAIRLFLNASCARLSPVLAKLAAATAKLTSLNSPRQPLVFGFCCGLAACWLEQTHLLRDRLYFQPSVVVNRY